MKIKTTYETGTMNLLDGIKVVDFSKWLPGQFCGMLLGDYGADIIKLEDLSGDAPRKFFPEREPGMSYWNLMLNRNKRSLAFDLKKEEGRELLLKLLKDADVFLEGFRPGYLARYGLDYGTVHAVNPRLIYVSVTGFGQSSHKPAHDLNVIGLAGLSFLDDEGEACVSEIQISALGSALNALSAISLALFARERSGEGQFIDVNLYATALSLQTTAVSSMWGCEETGTPRFSRVTHYYNNYRTKDGRYLTVGTIEPKFWQRFCDLIGCPELKGEQFHFAREKELIAIIKEKIAAKTLAEWLALIGNEEFCVTPVLGLKEALASELTAREEMLETKPSDIGDIRYLKGPVKFSAARSEIRHRAPRLGEHTAEILGALGYKPEEISALKQKNIIL